MAALGMFGLLQIVAFAELVRSHSDSKQFQVLLRAGVAFVFFVAMVTLVALTLSGVVAPWTGRFYSLWDTGYASKFIPIIASVSEHQPTPWTSWFFDLQWLIFLFPAGIYLCFQELKNEHVFVIVYAVAGSYFSGVMVRLMLTLTPVVCVGAAVAMSKYLDTFLKNSEEPTSDKGVSKRGIWSPDVRMSAVFPMMFLMSMYMYHCTYVTSMAYSSPSVVLASRNPDGSQQIIDDFREAYYWLRQNTAADAKVMSWWDYGYQIAGMADRPTLVDNNTWNNTHIATVGKAMSLPEEVSYPLMVKHDVEYVLVIFGGLLGYSGDDINKFLWMIRISQGVWPDEVVESNFFTPRGEYRVDD